MGLVVNVLGEPGLVRDGTQLPGPKGRKAWALLAYLTCTEGNATREQLAELLFSTANDPMRALRWNLTAIRQSLKGAGTVQGDPPILALEAGSSIDVRVLKFGSRVEAMHLSGLGRDLLEGMDPSSAAFQGWLLNERRHLRAISAAVLREAALAQLTSGRFEIAVDSAAKLVALQPLEEAYQALLIRSHVLAGDDAAAARQLTACVNLFRRELGIEPGRIVTSAMRTATDMPPPSVPGAVAARARLEAGEAAMEAGFLDVRLDRFWRTAAEAEASWSELLAARLTALGVDDPYLHDILAPERL